MKELLKLLEISHYNLKTNTGQDLINIWQKNEAGGRLSGIGNQKIEDVYSQIACGFWKQDKSECIKSITNYIQSDNSNPNSFLIGFFIAWVNKDIQHPSVEELARYFVKHQVFQYSLDMTVSDYLDKSKPKASHRPKRNIEDCLNSLMVYFDTQSINKTAESLGVDRKRVRSDLQRLAGEDVDYQVLISPDFTFYSSIQELYNEWKNNNNHIYNVGNK